MKLERKTPFRFLRPLILSSFTRDQLRTIAKHTNIPRGRNKQDTVNNLILYNEMVDPEKVKVTLTIEIDDG